jgi:hypothetical protein
VCVCVPPGVLKSNPVPQTSRTAPINQFLARAYRCSRCQNMSQLAVVVVRASVNANPHCPARDRHTFVSTGPQAKPFQRRDDMHACTCTRFLVLAHAVIRHRGLPSARFSVDEPELCPTKLVAGCQTRTNGGPRSWHRCAHFAHDDRSRAHSRARRYASGFTADATFKRLRAH